MAAACLILVLSGSREGWVQVLSRLSLFPFSVQCGTLIHWVGWHYPQPALAFPAPLNLSGNEPHGRSQGCVY